VLHGDRVVVDVGSDGLEFRVAERETLKGS